MKNVIEKKKKTEPLEHKSDYDNILFILLVLPFKEPKRELVKENKKKS